MNLKQLMDAMNYNMHARKGEQNPSSLGTIQVTILKLAKNLPTMTSEKWDMLTGSVITAGMGPNYDLSATTTYLNQNPNPTLQSETSKTR